MTAAVLQTEPAGIDLPLDPSLVEHLDEDEATALLLVRFRHFSALGLAWAEALQCAVGDRRGERLLATRIAS